MNWPAQMPASVRNSVAGFAALLLCLASQVFGCALDSRTQRLERELKEVRGLVEQRPTAPAPQEHR